MSEDTGISNNDAAVASNASDKASAESSKPSTAAALEGLSAGALLRQARQAKGLHIAALAVSLKVPQRKLEALEADRYAELTDATFVRALAQTVCRALKADPVPVLALLPQTLEPKLDRVSSGLNQPFHERPGRDDPKRLAGLLRPGPLLAMGLMLAAAALYLAPEGWWSGYGADAGEGAPQVVSAASAVSEGIFPPTVIVTTNTEAAPVAPAVPDSAASASAAIATVLTPPAVVAPAVVVPVAAAPVVSAKAAATASGALQLRAKEQVWVEVVDANGQALISRNLAPGEEIGIDGARPLKLKIGNAAGINVQFKGQSIDLTGYTRENVARLELK